MKYISKYNSFFFVAAGLVIGTTVFTKCMDNQAANLHASNTADYNAYAGSATCASCHKTIYESHVKTGHFKTSSFASAKTVLGSFDSGANTFPLTSALSIEMQKKADSFFQVSYVNGVVQRRESFDIIVGSGANGQSYEGWQNNSLVQLPVSYFTPANQWVNSPGHFYSFSYDRPITARCMECHATFVQKISGEKVMPEEFDKSKMILGIDCERCHGPSAKHVEYQQENPLEKIGRFVIDPGSFSRQQSLDMCSLCHRGGLQDKQPSFSFTAGDKLTDYFNIDSSSTTGASIDVHGNQFGLLAESKCFKNSSTLTCVTCHNTHEDQVGETASFSQKCMSCHNEQHAGAILCKVKNAGDAAVKNNCTSCHMPKLPSKAIAVVLKGDQKITPAMIHTHLIKIYPEESKKVEEFIKNSQAAKKL